MCVIARSAPNRSAAILIFKLARSLRIQRSKFPANLTSDLEQDYPHINDLQAAIENVTFQKCPTIKGGTL